MRALWAAALTLAAVASSAADSGLVDFSRRKALTAVEHPSVPKPWTSYRLHSEDGLSVFLGHVDPGVQRNVYRLRADGIGVALHDQRFVFKFKRPGRVQRVSRGDVFDQREGAVSGGWFAGGGPNGSDMLFITTASDMPDDLDQEAGAEARSEKADHPRVAQFKDSRAQVDEMSGDVRRARVIDAPSLKVDLLRLTGRAAIKNTAASSAVMLALKGSAEVRTAGPVSLLSGNRLYLTPPGAVAHVTPKVMPVYLLLITPAD